MDNTTLDSMSSATLTVRDEDGEEHIIHSDDFGIAAITDVLRKNKELMEENERLRHDLERSMRNHNADLNG